MDTAKSMSFLALLCCDVTFIDISDTFCGLQVDCKFTDYFLTLRYNPSFNYPVILLIWSHVGRGGAPTVLNYLHIWTYGHICTSVESHECNLSLAMHCCGFSLGLALQTLSADGKTWYCPTIVLGSGIVPRDKR